MKRRTATLLAWTTCALALVLIACILVMTFLNSGDLFDVNFAIVGVSSTIVGAAVASRRPANPVGWLFLGSALSSAIRVLAGEYAVYGIATNPGALPLPHALAWLSNTMTLVGPTMSFVLIPCTFPTAGRYRGAGPSSGGSLSAACSCLPSSTPSSLARRYKGQASRTRWGSKRSGPS